MQREVEVLHAAGDRAEPRLDRPLSPSRAPRGAGSELRRADDGSRDDHWSTTCRAGCSTISPARGTGSHCLPNRSSGAGSIRRRTAPREIDLAAQSSPSAVSPTCAWRPTAIRSWRGCWPPRSSSTSITLSAGAPGRRASGGAHHRRVRGDRRRSGRAPLRDRADGRGRAPILATQGLADLRADEERQRRPGPDRAGAPEPRVPDLASTRASPSRPSSWPSSAAPMPDFTITRKVGGALRFATVSEAGSRIPTRSFHVHPDEFKTSRVGEAVVMELRRKGSARSRASGRRRWTEMTDPEPRHRAEIDALLARGPQVARTYPASPTSFITRS